MGDLYTRYLLTGDPMHPDAGDMIAETTYLNVGLPVPEGWRVMSGNPHSSTIARVVLRYEIQPEHEGESNHD